MSTDLNDIANLLSNDNTRPIKFTLVFFLFFIGISQNLFQNLFGCNVKKLLKNNLVRHFVCLLFLFLLLDYITGLNVDNANIPNPFMNLLYSVGIYGLVILLFQTNVFYIYFISILAIVLLVLDKVKNYYQFSVKDQEILQQHLSFIYKLNNVLVIIGILTIVIGVLTTAKVGNLYNLLINNNKC